MKGIDDKELDEVLQILCEECAEIIHAYSKSRRHGFDSDNLGQLDLNNKEHLKKEIGQLIYVVAYARSLLGLSDNDLLKIGEEKKKSLQRYSNLLGVW